MSEYQYIEFLAIDKTLTAVQQGELRRHTTRARITSTSLVNEYEWGAGIIPMADQLLLRYFDAMVYTSNFGVREFKLRLPAKAISDAALRPYLGSNRITAASFRRVGDWLLLCWCTHEDDSAALEADGEGWMTPLSSLRGSLLANDFGALFLGWLRRVQVGELKPSAPIPPVPASLHAPSASLSGLAEFLDLDPSLVSKAKTLAQGMSRHGLRKAKEADVSVAVPSKIGQLLQIPAKQQLPKR